jgi:pimeloyl-ACP methyl ester carboxylesterase
MNPPPAQLVSGVGPDTVGAASVVEVEGRMVAYRPRGSGPPLVLLHGFSHDSRVWHPQLEDLADAFTVIAWDAPGAGQSSDPAEPFGIADWAACLAGFLDAIGVGRADIVGLSWGGLLAQEFYRTQPARVRSLVLADTYAGWKGPLSERVAEERLAGCLRDSLLLPQEFVPRYLPGMFSESVPATVRSELAGIMADFHPLGFRLMATALARADTRDALPTIQVPTLLIWGDQDARSPLAVAHQFLEAIPGARLSMIPRAGHVSNLERPDEFNEALRSFLQIATVPGS